MLPQLGQAPALQDLGQARVLINKLITERSLMAEDNVNAREEAIWLEDCKHKLPVAHRLCSQLSRAGIRQGELGCKEQG